MLLQGLDNRWWRVALCALLLSLGQGCSDTAEVPKPDTGLPPLPALVDAPQDRTGEVREPRELQIFLVGEVRGHMNAAVAARLERRPRLAKYLT